VQTLQALGAEVAARLKARKETIAVAESSAGGLINAALVACPAPRPITSAARSSIRSRA